MKKKTDCKNNNFAANYHFQPVNVATINTGTIPEDAVWRQVAFSCFLFLQSAFSKFSRGPCSKHRTDRWTAFFLQRCSCNNLKKRQRRLASGMETTVLYIVSVIFKCNANIAKNGKKKNYRAKANNCTLVLAPPCHAFINVCKKKDSLTIVTAETLETVVLQTSM